MPMNRASSGLAILVIGLVIWVLIPSTVIPDPALTANDANVGEKPIELAKEIPIDVGPFPEGTEFTFKGLQPHFDRLSWDSFVALNRPPDGKKIGEDNLAVWETWKEDYEIFLENGAEPSAWGAERQPPSHFSEKCKQLFLDKQEELRAAGKPLTLLE